MSNTWRLGPARADRFDKLLAQHGSSLADKSDMFVEVNGAKLFFIVEGPGLVPEGPRMREKPAFLLLHGGPGFDHTLYRPAFSALADIAQVVYLDSRERS
jgi:hypothetical protein